MSRFTPRFDCGNDPMAGGRRKTDEPSDLDQLRDAGWFWAGYLVVIVAFAAAAVIWALIPQVAP
jgi:hypothetical protein